MNITKRISINTYSNNFPMVINIASLFDKNYLFRALVLYESAKKFIPNAKFWFLCLDDETKTMLEKIGIENTVLMTPKEMDDKDLLGTESTRTRAEFAFTAKSNWLEYLVQTKKVRLGEILIWADADIMFYSSPQSAIDRILSEYSIAISPHYFTEKNKHRAERVGLYNAGFILFKIDSNSIKCLGEWSQQCIDWCYYRYEDGKLGDQMYLDDWHNKYDQVYDIPDKGVNLGPWNIRNYSIKEKQYGSFSIDKDPLICYHFHGLKIYLNRKGKIKAYPIGILNRKIYCQYLGALQREFEKIKAIDSNWDFEFAPKLGILRFIKQHIQRLLQ